MSRLASFLLTTLTASALGSCLPGTRPLLGAVSAALPGHVIRVFGKGGRAYGFTVENSYVVDETTNRSVFVSATIYANDNETINDDRYEYETVADPFIGHLGRVIARLLR